MITGTIEINRLKIFARHGVMDQERRVGNDFEVSLRLQYPFPQQLADGADDLSATLDYSAVIDVVRREMVRPSLLLESVALRLRDALLQRFPAITAGTITVAKLAPPIAGVELQSVAATISW